MSEHGPAPAHDKHGHQNIIEQSAAYLNPFMVIKDAAEIVDVKEVIKEGTHIAEETGLNAASDVPAGFLGSFLPVEGGGHGGGGHAKGGDHGHKAH